MKAEILGIAVARNRGVTSSRSKYYGRYENMALLHTGLRLKTRRMRSSVAIDIAPL
jgi:hypothetical protein